MVLKVLQILLRYQSQRLLINIWDWNIFLLLRMGYLILPMLGVSLEPFQVGDEVLQFALLNHEFLVF